MAMKNKDNIKAIATNRKQKIKPLLLSNNILSFHFLNLCSLYQTRS